MFVRPNNTYQSKFSQEEMDRIGKDEANPLWRIFQRIPPQARVLDIGAGNGILGKIFLHFNKEIHIDGLEPNPTGAMIARPFYRKFYQGFLADFINQIDFESYDFFILADVLEHLENPLAFLSELSSHINDQAKIVTSIPNIAFGEIKYKLLKGDFSYVDSGLLERTHLRFFTLQTILEMVRKSSLFVYELNFLNRDFRPFISSLPPNDFWDFFSINLIRKDPFSFVYQFLLVLGKKEIFPYSKNSFGQSHFPRSLPTNPFLFLKGIYMFLRKSFK